MKENEQRTKQLEKECQDVESGKHDLEMENYEDMDEETRTRLLEEQKRAQ